MEFMTDRIIKLLQERLDNIKELRDSGEDTTPENIELSFVKMFAQEITDRRIKIENEHVMWED